MESTLSLTVVDIRAEVGDYFGYGYGSVAPYTDPTWSTQQLTPINSCLRSGLTNFFYPVPAPGMAPYDWSFLRPVTQLTFTNGTTAMPLPDDFGGIEGEVTLNKPNGIAWGAIRIVNIGIINKEYSQFPNVTGRPIMCAVEWLRGTTPTAGSRARLAFYPQADQDYPVKFQYYVHQNTLDGTCPFPVGGMAHGETILESCLAVAEQRRGNTQGVHTANFAQRLQASIAADRRNKAQTLGYNHDRSALRRASRYGRYNSFPQIAYNGQLYS